MTESNQYVIYNIIKTNITCHNYNKLLSICVGRLSMECVTLKLCISSDVTINPIYPTYAVIVFIDNSLLKGGSVFDYVL